MSQASLTEPFSLEPAPAAEVTPSKAKPLTDVEDHLPFRIKLANLSAVVLPFLGVAAAMVLLWGTSFGWVYLIVTAIMYVLTAGGVTIGYHRLFTHRSYETGPITKFVVGVLASMSAEGPLFWWVAMHRRHHQHADHDDDPHSPHLHGGGMWGMVQGLWHAHIGWLFYPQPKDLPRYVGDLRKEPVLRWVHVLFPIWVALGIVIPAAITGWWTMSWTGALLGAVWGGFVRIFLVHHATWSINSVCHFWGKQDFESDDESRNNVVFGILSLGEGWHNNHHAFPTSARHGLKWWQFDATYVVIRGLERVGLVWKVKVPAPEAMAAKQRIA